MGIAIEGVECDLIGGRHTEATIRRPATAESVREGVALCLAMARYHTPSRCLRVWTVGRCAAEVCYRVATKGRHAGEGDVYVRFADEGGKWRRPRQSELDDRDALYPDVRSLGMFHVVR